MAWETRERGTRYYTKTRREDGRQIREYWGAGPLGEYMALIDQERRSLASCKTLAQVQKLAGKRSRGF